MHQVSQSFHRDLREAVLGSMWAMVDSLSEYYIVHIQSLACTHEWRIMHQVSQSFHRDLREAVLGSMWAMVDSLSEYYIVRIQSLACTHEWRIMHQDSQRFHRDLTQCFTVVKSLECPHECPDDPVPASHRMISIWCDDLGFSTRMSCVVM